MIFVLALASESKQVVKREFEFAVGAGRRAEEDQIKRAAVELYRDAMHAAGLMGAAKIVSGEQ